jgi:hemerythrin superfamily protein
METLGAALEREHHEIDEGIAAFLSEPSRTEPLAQAMAGLQRHIYLEEEFLFPPLREAGMMAPIFVMLREHGEMWATLAALAEELTDPSATGAATNHCRELVGQLERHNAKEEQILYVQADSVLTAAASAELQEFMASGRLPDGWVCIKART